MSFEAIGAIAALAAAFVLLARGASSRRARWLLLLGWLASCVALLAGAAVYRALKLEAPVENRPVEALRDGYTGSDACRSCHPREYDTWHHSWHRTMTQVVSPENAIADFSVGRLSHDGWHYDLEREGDTWWVRFDEPGLGGEVRRPLVLSTGSHHMQVYWLSLGDGVPDLGMLPFFFLKEEQRWVPRDSVFIQPERRGRPSIEPRRWNHRCLFCHSTHPNPQATPEAVETEVVEFGIACEACHGPGGAHVRANSRDPLRRYLRHLGGEPDDTIVQPERLPRERAVEVCGQCHGVLVPESMEERIRSFESGYRYRPGDVLAESGRIPLRGGPHASDPEIERVRGIFRDADLDSSFWSDGMPRVPREYNSLLQTACYQRGELSCQSCHAMHAAEGDPRSLEEWADGQLAPGMRGDAACLGCHSGYAQDLEAHTRHAPGSQGSRCQNCHMPYTTYALLKAIRQHQIDVPSARASAATGRPNACNACHLDRSLGWAARKLEEWTGEPAPELDAEQWSVAASVLWMLRGDAAQRALAAWHAGWEPAREASGGDWLAPHLAQLLEDPYPAVRTIAWRSLRSAGTFADLGYDYVGPAPDRARARTEAWRRWDAAARPAGGRAARLLLQPDGRVDRAAFAALWSQRDDRDVYVAE